MPDRDIVALRDAALIENVRAGIKSEVTPRPLPMDNEKRDAPTFFIGFITGVAFVGICLMLMSQ